MRVFLTGGTGFIGQPLAQALIERGWDVTALVRRPDGPAARTLARMGARCVAGDVTDRESMRAGMAGADIVVHNAGWYEIGVTRQACQRMRAINVEGTHNVLGLAQELGVGRVVHVSSTAYYGDTGPETRDETFQRQAPFYSCYEKSKADAHTAALEYQQRGLPLVVACPTQVMGPNDHSNFGYFLRLYLNRLMTPFGFSPELVLSPVHVADVGQGIALAAEKGRAGETYILGGDTMSLREVFAIWNSQPGGFKVRFYIPRWLAAAMFAPLEPLLRLAGLPAFLSRESVAISGIAYRFSSLKAQRELGWTCRPAQVMWLDIIDQELKLLAGRKKRDLVSRLKPVEA